MNDQQEACVRFAIAIAVAIVVALAVGMAVGALAVKTSCPAPAVVAPAVYVDTSSASDTAPRPGTVLVDGTTGEAVSYVGSDGKVRFLWP